MKALSLQKHFSRWREGNLRYFLGVEWVKGSENALVPPKDGHVLLAEPSLRDGVFDRSVVLLTGYDRKRGAHGLILNKPTGGLLGEFLSKPNYKRLHHLPVHTGGPVANDRMSFISLWWSEDAGLQWELCPSVEQTLLQAQRPGRLVRVFVGHSSWSPGQLEGEIKRGCWFPAIADPAVLGSELDAGLWPILMRKISPLHRILAEAPTHPEWN